MLLTFSAVAVAAVDFISSAFSKKQQDGCLPLLKITQDTVIVLVDNGSLRAKSYASMAQTGALLEQSLASTNINATVLPSSFRFSDRLPLARLTKIGLQHQSETLSQVLARCKQSQARKIVILPYFIGPSSQLDAIPEMVEQLFGSQWRARVSIGPSLYTEKSQDMIVQALCTSIQQVLPETSGKPHVFLIDHGSPSQRVTHVRNLLADLTRQQLKDDVCDVIAVSMERRPQPEYDFNEPLLENVFEQRDLTKATSFVLCYLFLSPGKHAGQRGDIDKILKGLSTQQQQSVKILKTRLLGETDEIVRVLQLHATDMLAT